MTFIERSEKRPSMWMGEVTIEAVSAYLLGFQACCFVQEFDDPLDGMRELIQCRLGRPCALDWTQVIRQFFSEGEDGAIRLISSSIHDLQRLKNEKGRNWLRSEFDRLQKLKRARPVNPSWPFPASRRH